MSQSEEHVVPASPGPLPSPSRIVVCGESLCSRGLVAYLREVEIDGEHAPVRLCDCLRGDPVPETPDDFVEVILVCASVCSGTEDPDIYGRLGLLYPSAKLIAMSPGSHASNLVTALDSGATGFVACGVDELSDVVTAVSCVLRGEIAYSGAVSRLIVTALRASGLGHGAGWQKPADDHGLTAREQHVLTLLCDGLSNQQIAQQLDISVNTVKNHLGHVYEKLGASSRGEAISFAVRVGLV